ncbi:hypothetical protein KR222_002615 [Zaprionus bogoriensis]|nr:hypothetical protein KR222_002615 [Zaprionus bogoriensis]
MIWIAVVRLVFTFLLGILLSYLLWMLVAIHFNLRLLYALIFPQIPVLVIFLLFNGVSFVVSRSVRAVTFLIFVGLFGNAGRSYLRAAAFALVITGPISNLLTNSGEVARVFACSTKLTFNVTKTRFDLMAKPFTNTLQHMKEDINEIHDSFKELQVILADLKYGVEHVDFAEVKYPRLVNITNIGKFPAGNSTLQPVLHEASDLQEKFLGDIRSRCKQQLHTGYQVCEQVFDQGYRKCATNFPNWLSSAICWPYRIDIICKVDMFGNPDKVCDAAKVLTPDFGRYYLKFLQAEQKLFSNSSSIEISYVRHNVTSSAQLHSAQSTSDEFLKDFDRRRRVFNVIMIVIEKFLSLFIVFVIISSVRYYWLYRSNVEYDNLYITEYFRHLDARRKAAKRSSILPLSSWEKSIYIDVNNICQIHESSDIKLYYFLQFSLEIIAVFIFIMLDRMFFNLLLTINHRSLVTYNQEGEHVVRYRINGTGLMARLLRTTMKNFNIHEQVATSLSNDECLPVANELPTCFYLKLFLLYLTILILFYKGSVLLRLRRVICSFFYPKREKQRILFLYGFMLSNRSNHLNVLRQTAISNMSQRHALGNVNICMMLYLSYPKQFAWMRQYRCTKRRCLVCNVLESDNFVMCLRCNFPYCSECYRDMTHVCVFCEYLIDSSSTAVPVTNRKKK